MIPEAPDLARSGRKAGGKCWYRPSVIVSRGGIRRRSGHLAIAASAAFVFGALLVHLSPWLAAGLGYSHDGNNAAVWGLGARGAVEDPIGNRLGGVQPDGTEYANHPPLLLWSLIPSTAIAEDSALGLRLVPLAASVATIALAALVLLDAGVSRWATSAGIILAGTTAMYLTYAALVDTPVFGLPFALASLWVAQRAWQGRPPATAAAIAIGALAALAGWQALLIAVLAGACATLAPTRSIHKVRVAVFGLLGGAAVGLTIDLLWTSWVDGGLSALLDQGASRTRLPTSMWFDQQVSYAVELYGIPLLVFVVGGIAASLLQSGDRGTDISARIPSDSPVEPMQLLSAPPRRGWESTRPAIFVMIVGLAGYSALFKHGAWVHSYWNFYGVALVAMTAATLLDAVARAVQQFSPITRTITIGGLVAIVAVIATTGAGSRSLSDLRIRQGLEVVPLVNTLPTATSPDKVVVNTIGGNASKPWLKWTTHGQFRDLSLDQISTLAPTELTLVTFPTAPRSLKPASGKLNGHFALVDGSSLRLLSGR